MKTAIIQARIEPKLKKEVEAILAEIGLSSSQAISMYFNGIKRHGGIPFELKVPNKATQKVIKDARAGRNIQKAKNPKTLVARHYGGSLMTLEAHYSKQFKKDLKRAAKRGKDVRKVQAVIDLLCTGEPLPARYGDHPLSGTWKGCRDCHLEFDWVLIYELYPGMVHFYATGTHDDLFDA